MRIELYLRVYAQAGPHQVEAVQRLEEIRGVGDIQDVEIHYWPAKTRISDVGDETVTGLYHRFMEWAESHGCRLPAFRLGRRTSGFTGDTDSVIMTPVACLAVYEDGELREVYPRVEDGEHRAVTDFLGELEDDSKEPSEPVHA